MVRGHEDTKTTIQYLGINMDDKAEAMDQLFKFQSALLKGKNGSASKMVDGPGFIRTVLSGQDEIFPKFVQTFVENFHRLPPHLPLGGSR
jgi:hypothetical protein